MLQLLTWAAGLPDGFDEKKVSPKCYEALEAMVAAAPDTYNPHGPGFAEENAACMKDGDTCKMTVDVWKYYIYLGEHSKVLCMPRACFGEAEGLLQEMAQ